MSALVGAVPRTDLSWTQANMEISDDGEMYTLMPVVQGSYVNIANATIADLSGNGKYWASISFPAEPNYAYVGFATGEVDTEPVGMIEANGVSRYDNRIKFGVKKEASTIVIVEDGVEVSILDTYNPSDIYEISYANSVYYLWKNGAAVHTYPTTEPIADIKIRVVSYDAVVSVSTGTFTNYSNVNTTMAFNDTSISWIPLPDASSYVYKIYSDAALTTLDISGETIESSAIVPALEVGEEYWITVTTVFGDGTSRVSSPYFFEKIPADVNVSFTLENNSISWDSTPDAINYIYKIYSDAALTILDISGETPTESTPMPALGVGEFRITVTTVFGNGYSFVSSPLIINNTLNVSLDELGTHITAVNTIPYNGIITAAHIPSSITHINDNVFEESTLISVELPNTIISIGTEAFRNCASLTSVSVPGEALVGTGIFINCSALSSVALTGPYTSIPASIFNMCAALTSFNFPSSLLSIGENAFYGSGLTAIETVNLEELGDSAFQNCTSLLTVDLSGSFTILPDGVFSGCTSLQTVSLPASVEEIGEYAFSESGLTTIDIGNITQIGWGAFEACQSLVSATLRGTFTYLPEEVFTSCFSLTSVSFPATVTEIKDRAFSNCPALRFADDKIPEGIESIFSGAFTGYQGTKLYLPSTLSSLYVDALYSNVLTKIYFLGPLPNLATSYSSNGNSAQFLYLNDMAAVSGHNDNTWADLGGTFDPTPDDPNDLNFTVIKLADYSVYANSTIVFAHFIGEQLDTPFILYDGNGAQISTAISNHYYESLNIHRVIFTAPATVPTMAYVNSNAIVPVSAAIDVIYLSSNSSGSSIRYRGQYNKLDVYDTSGNLVGTTEGSTKIYLYNDSTYIADLSNSSIVVGTEYVVRMVDAEQNAQSTFILCVARPPTPNVVGAVRVGENDVLTVDSIATGTYWYLNVNTGVSDILSTTTGTFTVTRGYAFIYKEIDSNVISALATYEITELLSPVDLSRNTVTGDLEWSPITYAQGYKVYVKKVGDANPTLVSTITDASTSVEASILASYAIFTADYYVSSIYNDLETATSAPLRIKANLANAAPNSVNLEDVFRNQNSTGGDLTVLRDALINSSGVFQGSATIDNANLTTLFTPAAGAEDTFANRTLFIPLFVNGTATIEQPSAGTVVYMAGAPGAVVTLNLIGSTTAIIATIPDISTNPLIITDADGNSVEVDLGGTFQNGSDVYMYGGYGSAAIIPLPRTEISRIYINDVSYNVSYNDSFNNPNITVEVPAGTVSFNPEPINQYADVSGIALSYEVGLGLSVPVSFDVLFDDGNNNTETRTLTYTLRGVGSGAAGPAPSIYSIAPGYGITSIITLSFPANAIRYGEYAIYNSEQDTIITIAGAGLTFNEYGFVYATIPNTNTFVYVRGYNTDGNGIVSDWSLAAGQEVDRTFIVPMPSQARVLSDNTKVSLQFTESIADISSFVIITYSDYVWGSVNSGNSPLVASRDPGSNSTLSTDSPFFLGAFSKLTPRFALITGPNIQQAIPPTFDGSILELVDVSATAIDATITGIASDFPITSYTLTLTNNGTGVPYTGSSLPLRINGLARGIEYSWSLSATSAAGTNDINVGNPVIPTLAVPTRINVATTANASTDDLDISWASSTNATGYTYIVSDVSSMNTVVLEASIAEPTVKFSFPNNDLLQNKTYWITIRPTNTLTQGVVSRAFSFRTPIQRVAPTITGAVLTVPVNTTQSDDTAILSGTFTAGTATISGYTIWIFPANTPEAIFTGSSSTTTFQLNVRLDRGLTYKWRARATSAHGQSDVYPSENTTETVSFETNNAPGGGGTTGGGGGTTDGGGGGGVICFLGNAPVLTPAGYRRIDSLREGDIVQTADGRAVAIQRTVHQRVSANSAVNPYIIERGQFGATKRLLISPEHRVAVAGRGLIEARNLGLKQEERTGILDYYNIELPDWERDNMVVAGVEVESLAPVRRIVITHAAFRQMIARQFGEMTPAVQAKILRTCKFLPGGQVEVPAMRRN
jgi:hypothetical protein